MDKESQGTKGTISHPRKLIRHKRLVTEYLQEIKHKAKTESNCEYKTEHPQNRNADTVDPLTCPDGAEHMER